MSAAAFAAAFAAERAVLGALVVQPHRITDLNWLQAADFLEPAFRTLFEAMRNAAKREYDLGDPVGLHAWRVDVAAQLEGHGIQFAATDIRKLAAACPSAENVIHYGRIVALADTHRQIAAHARKMAAAMETGATRADQLGEMFESVKLARDVLGNLGLRWGITGEELVEHVQDNGRKMVREARELALAGTPARSLLERVEDRFANLRPQSRHLLEQEDSLLASLAAEPAQIPDVRNLLRTSDFAGNRRSEIYDMLLEMHDRGEPIDRVSLPWRAEERGIIGPEGMAAKAFLDRYFTNLPAAATHVARDVILAAIQRDTSTHLETMQQGQNSSPGEPRELILENFAAVANVLAHRDRYEAATTQSHTWPTPDHLPRVAAPSAGRQALPVTSTEPGNDDRRTGQIASPVVRKGTPASPAQSREAGLSRAALEDALLGFMATAPQLSSYLLGRLWASDFTEGRAHIYETLRFLVGEGRTITAGNIREAANRQPEAGAARSAAEKFIRRHITHDTANAGAPPGSTTEHASQRRDSETRTAIGAGAERSAVPADAGDSGPYDPSEQPRRPYPTPYSPSERHEREAAQEQQGAKQ